jgi:hypothetical protein
MSVPYAPVAWGTEAARRTFGPVGAYMGPYTAGRTVATCDDMGWRRGRACVAFCSAWCSVLVAPLRQWGGALGSGVAWTVLVVWVGVSALRLWAEWPGYDERTTASLHTSLVAATSHTAGRGFHSHRSAPATARSSSPPSTSARRTGFSVSRRCHAAGRLALAVAPRHTGAPHTPTALNCLLQRLRLAHGHWGQTPTALNCLLCCSLSRAFLLVLLMHCIFPASFYTLQYVTQNLQNLTHPLPSRHISFSPTGKRCRASPPCCDGGIPASSSYFDVHCDDSTLRGRISTPTLSFTLTKS